MEWQVRRRSIELRTISVPESRFGNLFLLKRKADEVESRARYCGDVRTHSPQTLV